jgi:hypothetical protein
VSDLALPRLMTDADLPVIFGVSSVILGDTTTVGLGAVETTLGKASSIHSVADLNSFRQSTDLALGFDQDQVCAVLEA